MKISDNVFAGRQTKMNKVLNKV